jgi:hypothetical protein
MGGASSSVRYRQRWAVIVGGASEIGAVGEAARWLRRGAETGGGRRACG